MKCDECGTENLEGSSFCKKCGKSFIEENPPTKVTEGTDNNIPDVYCECGQILKKDWNYCPSCKKPITEDIKKTITSEDRENKKNDNAFIYIILFIISIASSFLLNFSWGLIIAVVIIITGLINHPDNKLLRTIFIVSIILFILYIIFVVWIIMTCINTISSCPG